MIHMHLLQSPVQKAYGLRRHGKPTVFWLDDLGLVESNVVYGHAIHVTEAEIELMGRRQCLGHQPSELQFSHAQWHHAGHAVTRRRSQYRDGP